MAEVQIATTPGTNISTGLDNIYACCISSKFNTITSRIFVASSPKTVTSGFTIRYADYIDTNWTTFTSISNSREDTENQGWTAITSTVDGTKVYVAGLRGYIYMSTWGGASYSALQRVNGYVYPDIVYSGIKTTSNGSRLVVMARGGNLWSSSWDGSSNYNIPPINVRLPSSSDTNFAMASNGSRIVYAGTDNKLYILTWDGNTYSNNTVISTYIAPSLSTYRALEFSVDMRVLYATTNNSNILSYFVWDKTENNYNVRNTYTIMDMSAGSYNKTAIGIINPTRTKSQLYIVDNFNRSQNILYNYDINIYAPTPVYDISFDLLNTKTVATGNLQVSIHDPDNTRENLYYFYSLDGTNFNNSNVLADSGTSPYRFYINTLDISNTIYVKVDDTFGNTSNVSSAQVIVYQTTRSPPVINAELVGSGNVQVTIGEYSEFSSPIPDYYYLNNVSYFAYRYSGVGQFLFNNPSSYTISLGNLSATNTTYEPTVSYITGLSDNTYTVFFTSRNDFTVGQITQPSILSITVYVTPKYAPVIDVANTRSTSSGSITVSLIDGSNSAVNNILYLYSLDGGQTYRNSGIVNNGSTQYSFTVPDIGNAQIPLIANTYSLSILASNQYGNMASIPRNVSVYTTPISPVIDVANTRSTSSESVTVSIIDTSNTEINSVYYLYSFDGGITYGNSGVRYNGNTRYSFTVSDTGNAQIPLIANVYSLSIRASNVVGNADSIPTNVSVFAIPYAISAEDTYAVSTTPNQFTVAFFDRINHPINQVYYLVSIDGGNTYANTGIACTGVPTREYKYIITTGVSGSPTYNTFIQATNQLGNSMAVNAIPYTTPDSPIVVNAIPGIRSIIVGFKAPTFNGGNTITQYEYSTDNGTQFWSIDEIPPVEPISDTMSFSITVQSNGINPFENGQLYSVVMRARNQRGYSATSANTVYAMPFDVPDPPILYDVIAGNQVIDISFSAPVWDGGNSITQYQYSINNSQTYRPIDAVILGNINSYRIEGLENGNIYAVSVRATNSRGNSASSNVFSNIVPYGIPDAPVLFTIPQHRTIEVSFTTPNNRGREITGYKYSVDGGNIFANVVPFPASNLVSGTTTFSIYHVKNGREYPLNVKSVNSIGESAVSSRVYTISKTFPDEPTILDIIPLDEGVDVVFSPPANNGGNVITTYTYGYVLFP